MGFNSVFKGLKKLALSHTLVRTVPIMVNTVLCGVRTICIKCGLLLSLMSSRNVILPGCSVLRMQPTCYKI